LKKDRPLDAIAELERAKVLESEPRIVSALAFAYGVAGETAKAQALIADMESDSAKRYVSPFSIALAYSGLGEEDVAIDWLEKARAERSDAMAILEVHPLLLQLHSNPRFDRLAKRSRISLSTVNEGERRPALQTTSSLWEWGKLSRYVRSFRRYVAARSELLDQYPVVDRWMNQFAPSGRKMAKSALPSPSKSAAAGRSPWRRRDSEEARVLTSQDVPGSVSRRQTAMSVLPSPV
jgi:hypothetical protein